MSTPTTNDVALVLQAFREFTIRNSTQWQLGANHHHPIWAKVADTLDAFGLNGELPRARRLFWECSECSNRVDYRLLNCPACASGVEEFNPEVEWFGADRDPSARDRARWRGQASYRDGPNYCDWRCVGCERKLVAQYEPCDHCEAPVNDGASRRAAAQAGWLDKNLCVDEGCEHHGTPHVCVSVTGFDLAADGADQTVFSPDAGKALKPLAECTREELRDLLDNAIGVFKVIDDELNGRGCQPAVVDKLELIRDTVAETLSILRDDDTFVPCTYPACECDKAVGCAARMQTGLNRLTDMRALNAINEMVDETAIALTTVAGREMVGQAIAAATRKCRVCGCVDIDCLDCIKATGQPCFWVENDLCSACLPGVRGPSGDSTQDLKNLETHYGSPGRAHDAMIRRSLRPGVDPDLLPSLHACRRAVFAEGTKRDKTVPPCRCDHPNRCARVDALSPESD